mmetsp:Transcript_47719/g.97549  ORF Transcript_47719/g.97549 Transcript_47719/m.97549 type:complete len:303 (+) Transcript_47719:127-1035(+)
MTEKKRVVLRPFPIFNMGKEDILYTGLLFAFCALTVIIVRSSQSTPPQGNTVWKGVVVIMGGIMACVFFVLCIAKMCFGYSPEEAFYEELVDEGKVTREGPIGVDLTAEAPPYAKTGGQAPFAGDEQEADWGKGQSGAYQDDVERQSTAALDRLSGYRQSKGGISPRREDDEVGCGIELEQCPVEFEHHGILHEKGTFRVRKVMKDGVCDRQGTCHEGDILVTINGVRIAGMPLSKVHAQLRAKAGSSIVLGLCMEKARTVTDRTVVLAPYPQLSTSPRYSGAAAYTASGAYNTFSAGSARV